MANLEVDQAFLSGVAYGKQSLCEDLRQRLGQLRLGYRGQRALRPILADLSASPEAAADEPGRLQWSGPQASRPLA